MSHPINWKRIVSHVLFWVFYLLYSIVDNGWDSKDHIVLAITPELWTDFPLEILMVYTNLYFLMPRYLYPKRRAQYAISLFLLMIAGGVFSRLETYLVVIPW